MTRTPLTFRLDALRRAVEATLISTATVRRLSREEDTSGGYIDTYANVGTYPCRFHANQITPIERESTFTVQTIVYWRFLFPYTADVLPTDRLVVGTRVFEVVHDGMGSIETALVVLCQEIT